jgi:hypothetical protein
MCIESYLSLFQGDNLAIRWETVKQIDWFVFEGWTAECLTDVGQNLSVPRSRCMLRRSTQQPLSELPFCGAGPQLSAN